MQRLNKKIREAKKLIQLYETGSVFTAFDTETTGLTPTTSRIIEIGAVKFNKDGIISSFSSLTNPQVPIPNFTTELTGITSQMVMNAPHNEEVIKSFRDFIGNSILIAHNAQFDLNFLNAESELAGLKVSTNNFADTLILSNQMYPELEKHKLDFLADALKINKGNSHRAFDDANTCYQLFLLCLEKYKKIKGIN